LALLLGGCISAPPKPPLPAAALRTPLGRVAVVTFANAREIQLQVPDSKTDIAQETASFVPVSPTGLREVAPFVLFGGPEVGAGFAILALSAPVVLMIGQPVAQRPRCGAASRRAPHLQRSPRRRNRRAALHATPRRTRRCRGAGRHRHPAPAIVRLSTPCFLPEPL